MRGSEGSEVNIEGEVRKNRRNRIEIVAERRMTISNEIRQWQKIECDDRTNDLVAAPDKK